MDDDVQLRVRVTDSGNGFDFEKFVTRAKDAVDTVGGYHGRGIRLLWDLCETVNYVTPGNQIEVTMHWNVNDE